MGIVDTALQCGLAVDLVDITETVAEKQSDVGGQGVPAGRSSRAV